MRLKEALKIFIFTFLFLIFFVSVSYIVRTNGHVKDRFAGFYAEEKDTIDVLMFGASPVGTSFSPGYMWGRYGFTAYPLSSNSQRPKAIRYLIEEACKYQTPRLVVIELRMFTYDDEEMAQDEAHIREVTDNMRYSFQRIKTIRALTEKMDDPLSFYLDIFKFHSNWKMLLLPEEIAKFHYQKYDVNKGFENPDTIMYHDAPQALSDTKKRPIPESQEECLFELISYLKENDQDALFVVAPQINNVEYQEKMNYMKDLIEEEGFSYLNLNEHYEELQFDFATDLMDGAHTNILGAKKCSDFLGNYIKETYDMQDKRQEIEYIRWNKSYEEFLSYYEKVKNGR